MTIKGPASTQGLQLKACPECGDIRPSGFVQDYCGRCAAQGHLYRMLTVEELSRSVEQNLLDGFRQVAVKRASIRDAMRQNEVKPGT